MLSQARQYGSQLIQNAPQQLNRLVNFYTTWTWFLIYTLPVLIFRRTLEFWISRATSVSTRSLIVVEWNIKTLASLQQFILKKNPIKLDIIDRIVTIGFLPLLLTLDVLKSVVNVAINLLGDARKANESLVSQLDRKPQQQQPEVDRTELTELEKLAAKEKKRREQAELKQKELEEKINKLEKEHKDEKKHVKETERKHFDEDNKKQWEILRLRQELEKLEEEKQELERKYQKEKKLIEEDQKKQQKEQVAQFKKEEERIRNEERERLKVESQRIKEEKKKLKQEKKQEELRMRQFAEQEERARIEAEEKRLQIELEKERVFQEAEQKKKELEEEEARILREKEEYERKQEEEEQLRNDKENIAKWQQLALKQELEKQEEKNKYLEDVIVKEEKREERKEIKKKVQLKKKEQQQYESSIEKLESAVSHLRDLGSERIEQEQREKKMKQEIKEQQQFAKEMANTLLQQQNKPSLESLIDRVRKNDPTLVELDLKGYYVLKDELKQLIDVAVNNTYLVELDITDNTAIGNSSVQDLVRLLDQNKSIRRLYLRGTAIDNFAPLVKKLERNHNIVEFILPENADIDTQDKCGDILARNELEKNQNLVKALSAQ
jgi:chemotaxis protein histidine kinase CheA